VVCTSSNAERALDWAFEQGDKVLLPARPAPRPQHRGAGDGLSLDDCVLYDPHKPNGGLTDEQLRDAKMILWRGHCSVHGRFTLDSVDEVRERVRASTCWCTPSAARGGPAADLVGSTEYIIKTLDAGARPARPWAVGTELNLVRRLANAGHPDKQIMFLDRTSATARR
jgi:quinolinate synthase